MGNLGFSEMLVIFILALLIFGPRKLPELGRALGKALAEFRRASTDFRLAIEDEMREIEHQAREIEQQARDAVSPPEQSLGAGLIAPSPPADAAQARTEEKKPTDGDPRPA
jgi:TatA/E family protein of Tat protein translocase